MRVARNKDNTLMLFPDFGSLERNGDIWRFYTFSSIIKGDEWFGSLIDSKLFPELKWEDEPLEVALVKIDNIQEIDDIQKCKQNQIDNKAAEFIKKQIEKEKIQGPKGNLN